MSERSIFSSPSGDENFFTVKKQRQKDLCRPWTLSTIDELFHLDVQHGSAGFIEVSGL